MTTLPSPAHALAQLQDVAQVLEGAPDHVWTDNRVRRVLSCVATLETLFESLVDAETAAELRADARADGARTLR